MRIRKHAGRTSSLPLPTQSCGAAAAAAAAAVAGGRELEMHVCELNQSPWDAMAFTPPGPVALYSYYEEAEAVEEDRVDGFVWGAVGSGQREEEPAAAASDVSGIATTPLGLRRHAKMEETAEEPKGEDKRWVSKSEVKKRSANKNKKKIKRNSTASSCAMGQADELKKVKREAEPADSTTVVTTCKKSDGKGWHCKREAQPPHTLCKYHLTQVRSYYSNGGCGSTTTHVLQQQFFSKTHGGSEAKQEACISMNQDKKVSTIKQQKNKKKDDRNGNAAGVCDSGAAGRTRRKAASDFYYYYSGFGPWWGKSRNGGGDRDGRDRVVTSNVDASDGDDGGDGACDGAPPPRVHDQKPDDLDEDDDDDDDDVDDVGGLRLGESEGDDVVAIKRKGRKPIKARSLKSLL